MVSESKIEKKNTEEKVGEPKKEENQKNDENETKMGGVGEKRKPTDENSSSKRLRDSSGSPVSKDTVQTNPPELDESAKKTETSKEKEENAQTEGHITEEKEGTERSPTNSLFIKNFVRPFPTSAVVDLLKGDGREIKQWTMNNIKSKCYVTYTRLEDAIKAHKEIDNLLWPPENKARLSAEFISEEEAEKFYPKKETSEKAKKTTTTLDDLFCKTQAQPTIYYLPLTDEQVLEKRKQKNNSNSRRTPPRK